MADEADGHKSARAWVRLLRWLVAGTLLLEWACSGGGGSSGQPGGTTTGPTKYTIGGSAAGLSGPISLENNAGDSLTLPGSGDFVFAIPLASGAAYNVTVTSPPSGQTCSVTNGSGTVANANITNVQVACSDSSGGSGSGGSGSSGGSSGSGTSGSSGASGSSGGSGSSGSSGTSGGSGSSGSSGSSGGGSGSSGASGSSGSSGASGSSGGSGGGSYYTVGGTITNLRGASLSLLLQNGGGYASNIISVLPGASTFTFGTGLPSGTAYTVTVSQQPAGQSCTVGNGSGTLSGANTTSVSISCSIAAQWAWISGDDTSRIAVYGTHGQASATNTPGGRARSASATDGQGNLWLFGGSTPSNGSYNNDLWVYSPGTGQWMWVSGSSQPNAVGIYGTLGIAANTNVPGARFGATAWTDTAGNIWLFGGQGYDSAGTQGWLNDLWEYSTSTHRWTWISGSSLANPPGVYGTIGVAAGTNYPGGRLSPVGWIDLNNRLWVAGGTGFNSSSQQTTLDDLWMYDPQAGLWTWVGGTQTGYSAGAYGSLGVEASANSPGARQGAVSWTDGAGQLWMFGGYGLDGAGTYDALNDLWRYNPASGLWTWMGGSKTVDALGIYGVQGVAAASNSPGARYGSSPWVDVSGTLWLLGGEGYDSTSNPSNIQNDFWNYDPAAGTWAWVSGGNADGGGDPGVYQAQGQPAGGNSPGARTSGISWSDGTGFWLYGGTAASPMKVGGASYTISQNGANDLWHYGTAIFYNGTGSMTGTFTDQNGCQYPANATIVNANVTMSTASAGAVTITYTVPPLANQTANCPSYQANSGSFTVPVTVNGTAMQSVPGSFGSVTATISGNVISGTTGFQESGTQGTGSYTWTESGNFSASAPAVTVPNVVGSTQAAAVSTVTGAGLRVTSITRQNSSTVAAGKIISQQPGASSTAAAGSSVTLVVSSGPPKPVVSLQANPGVTGAGQPVTLTWSSSAATSCSATNGWSGSQPTSGTTQIIPQSLPITFTLTCSGTGGSTSASATVLTGEPAAIVDAPSTVGGYAFVQLDGSYSQDATATLKTYSWSQVSGPSVTLTGATTAKASFIAPQVTSSTTLQFSLTVADSTGVTSSSSVTVVVNPATAAQLNVAIVSASLYQADTSSAHTEFDSVDGPPLSGSTSYVMRIAMSGALQSPAFSLIDATGNVLSTFSATALGSQSMQPLIFQGSITVPSVPFRVAASGISSDGQNYSIQSASLMTPMLMTASFVPSTLHLSVGASGTSQLTIYNGGSAAQFSIAFSDPTGLLANSPPTSVQIGASSSATVPVNVVYPASGNAIGPDVTATVAVTGDPTRTATVTLTLWRVPQ